MRMKCQIMDVDIPRLDFHELIIGPIEEVPNKHLFLVPIIDSPREEFNLFLDSFLRRNNNDVSIRIQYFGNGRNFDSGR